jgi:hypothetical protein
MKKGCRTFYPGSSSLARNRKMNRFELMEPSSQKTPTICLKSQQGMWRLFQDHDA